MRYIRRRLKTPSSYCAVNERFGWWKLTKHLAVWDVFCIKSTRHSRIRECFFIYLFFYHMRQYKLFFVGTVLLFTFISNSLVSSVSADSTISGGYSLSVQEKVLADRATTKLTNILSGKSEAYRAKVLSQLVRSRDTTASNNPRISALLAQVIYALNWNTSANSSDTVSVDQFLNDISAKFTTEAFRSKVAQSIYKVWGLEWHNDYVSLYDLLPSCDKDVLSSRYGIKDRVSFNENVGPSGLNFKFTPYDFIGWKYVPFSSGTLAIVSKPTKDDIILDASGKPIGIKVSVWLPWMVTSSSKTGKKDYGKGGAPTNVFVSTSGEVFPTYFGLVRTLATGKWIEVMEFFKTNPKSTALSVGTTQGSATDDQSKIFGKLSPAEVFNSVHGITATIKDSNGNVVGTMEGVQDEKVDNGFISNGFSAGLTPGQEYTVEIRSTFNINNLGIDKVTPLKTVKFRY